jgi:hypothetical protein
LESGHLGSEFAEKKREEGRCVSLCCREKKKKKFRFRLSSAAVVFHMGYLQEIQYQSQVRSQRRA